MKNCPQHGERDVISCDFTEMLELQRLIQRVRITKYPTFACPDKPRCGVASPERRTGLVEGNLYDTSVAAEMITDKYGCWTPTCSTLLNLLVASAFVIRPLIESCKQAVLGDSILSTDETRTTLLLPKAIPKAIEGDAKSQRVHEVFSKSVREKRRSASARMWAYRGVSVSLYVLDFAVSRHPDDPDAFLENFLAS